MADHHGAGAQAGDEALQPVQPVQVEVVGRLVEQEDVVAAEQQRGEAGAGGLAAGQRRSSAWSRSTSRPSSAATCAGPLVQVGAAEGEPALQSVRVRVVGARPPRRRAPRWRRPSRPARRLTPVRRARNSPDRLARPALRLLRQVADGRRGRAERDRALLAWDQPGEDTQQRGLARAVGPDQPDHVAGRDDQVEVGEEEAVTVAGGEVLGDQRGAHQVHRAYRRAHPDYRDPRSRRHRSEGDSQPW